MSIMRNIKKLDSPTEKLDSLATVSKFEIPICCECCVQACSNYIMSMNLYKVLRNIDKGNRKQIKWLLIIDNTPTHPSFDKLNSVNEYFKVQFLPPNVTVLIQPLNQISFKK